MAGKAIQLALTYTFSVASLSMNADTGVITIGTPTLLTGKAARASVRFQNRLIEVNSLDATIVNHLKLRTDWTVSLTEIQFRGSGTPNPIQAVAMGFDGAQLVITSNTKAWTFQGTIEG